jgi:2'-5' RNA ligase
VKPGTVIMAELTGELRDRVHAIQQRFDPRMARELPPHITLTGSSGMGPIPPSVTPAELEEALAPIAAGIAPVTVEFQPPMRFMQSLVVVMPLDPNGPLRALHEAIKTSGIPYEPPRFTFTPHLTLSFYPELSRERLRELLAVRIPERFTIRALQFYRSESLTRSRRILDLPLGGPDTPHHES